MCCLLCFALLAGCSKDDAEPDDVLPPLVWPDDIATAIPSEEFRKYCLYLADKDRDGKISKDEALGVEKLYTNAVTSAINLNRVSSLSGIQYFSNLREFWWNKAGLVSADLAYNTRLESIVCCAGSSFMRLRFPATETLTTVLLSDNPSLREVDLSGCPKLKELNCNALSTSAVALDVLNLPQSADLEFLRIALTANGSYADVLDRCPNLKILECCFCRQKTLDLTRLPGLETLMLENPIALKTIRLKRGCPAQVPEGIVNREGEEIEVVYMD